MYKEKIKQLIPAIGGWEICIRTVSFFDGKVEEYETTTPVLVWALIAQWNDVDEDESAAGQIVSPVFIDDDLGIITEEEFYQNRNNQNYSISVHTFLKFNGKPAVIAVNDVLKKSRNPTEADYTILAGKVCKTQKSISAAELSKRFDIPVNFIEQALIKAKKTLEKV